MTEGENNKVSIVIPTYNYAHFLRDALESALGQTHRSIEVVVLDNCSTDDTAEVVKPYLKSGNVRYVRNEKNVGFVGNLNRSLDVVETKLMTILCADDILEKNFVVDALEKINSLNVGVVSGGALIIDKRGNPKRRYLAYWTDRMTKDSGLLVKGNYLGLTGTLFNVQLARQLNLRFNPEYKLCPDWDFWLRLGEKTGIYYIAQVLFQYREHDANNAFTLNKLQEAEENVSCIKSFLFGNPKYQESAALFNVYFNNSQMLLKANLYKDSARYFRLSAQHLSLKNTRPVFFIFPFLYSVPSGLRQGIIKFISDHNLNRIDA